MEQNRPLRLNWGAGPWPAAASQAACPPHFEPPRRPERPPQGEALPPTRRQFLSAALIGLTRKSPRPISGGLVDDGHEIGHALRDHTARSAPKQTIRIPVVIVGGGIAGLSAAWRLDQRGFHDFVLLEMNGQAGGNSRWGESEISAYPWAAHYVPIPNRESVLVRELMQELGVLRDGEWDERCLCFSPQERLYLHGRWQEGIEPDQAATARDREQFHRFHERMREFRATGQFTIPASIGAKPSPLANISMADWLRANAFDSPALDWYVDYACRDDYGAHTSATSAWAGIHYFASREHDEKGPLTWPEGNGWIVRRLLAKLGRYVRTNSPVARIETRGRSLRVLTSGAEYVADRVIFAAPTFLAPYLIENAPRPSIAYSPWVTANLTLDRLPRERGFPLAWDNVIYQSPALGYVVATHQNLGSRAEERSVWTWYHALADMAPANGRTFLLAQPWSYWRDFILDDLARAHPDIRDCVTRIDVLRLGHAMARPAPGFDPARVYKPFGGLHFANSDLSGLSIFEEAQHNGVVAADNVLRQL